MRTNEEMLRAVHDRAGQMLRNRIRRQNILMGGSAVLCAVALMVLIVVNMPSVMDKLPPKISNTMQASILTDSGVLGYAVVSIVAFLLGVAVTAFCMMLRNRNNGENKNHDRDR